MIPSGKTSDDRHRHQAYEMMIDYSQIAKTYDQASFRAVKEVDPILLVIAKERSHVRVLDLACGTGNYIRAQRQFIHNARFVGLDSSFSMISHAKMKGLTELAVANADLGLPFADGSMDYVVCRFGFHHFTNKFCVLKEIWRCLRRGGVLHMLDVDPHRNKNWWVYCLFPELAAEDRRRFWESSRLLTCLRDIGFEAYCRIETGPEIMTKNTLLQRLRIRDTSQLHMIDQKSYESELRGVECWPENMCLEGDYAFLSVTGKKTLTNIGQQAQGAGGPRPAGRASTQNRR
ncbi:MAG: methyltransferase domain-containing protein [Pseudomonadota bacterium]